MGVDKSLQAAFDKAVKSSKSKAGCAEFRERLDQYLPVLQTLLSGVYGDEEATKHLPSLVATLTQGFIDRSEPLRLKDMQRIADPRWFKSEKMVGMAVYVDLVAEDLQDLRNKLPYYADLGVTYLHLMPLYKAPEGDSDGGYAVSDYRTVNPRLGSMDDLRELAEAMAEFGMSMVLDFVFNHTSDEHEWALAAKAGDEVCSNYYYMFNDRVQIDQYERTLREIFPSVRRGSFSQIEDGRWVWTTFNNFQWDLNYSNPEVFRAIVGEMLYLANVGCDVLRLDALAFIWKEMGTTCENQPNAHRLIQAFNTCLRIAAPAVVFKSEAIVHPDEVIQYISPKECQLSYNPLLMALIWEGLATRQTNLMTKSLSYRLHTDSGAAWVNYVRCHDDIGWTFDDRDAKFIGINGYDHRLFLNKFYTDQFDGSFAKGLGFQFNPENGDCRVCGSLASLCGLEKALERGDSHQVWLAERRILMIHSIIMSIGGVPLLYQGDELAMLNDYSFAKDVTKVHDARWVNRPKVTEANKDLAKTMGTVQNRVFTGLKHMIALRKSMPVFGDARTQVYETGSEHCFAYLRAVSGGDKLLCLCNFSENEQWVEPSILEKLAPAKHARDLINGFTVGTQSEHYIQLAPYQVMWLHTTP
jgi:amylosucrase